MSRLDSFTKAVLERYKDKAKILYIELKEEEILGLFLLKESLIFQNCVKETSAKWHFVLNVSMPKNMRRYFEASSIIKCNKDIGNKNVIGFD